MKIDFSYPDFSDIPNLKKLWLSSFEESPKAVDLFFDKCFIPQRAYIAKYNDKIVSALYLIDTSFNCQKSHYLCGASTDIGFRNKGIMSKLIKFALDDSAKNGDKYSFLLPANNELYSYYSKLDYSSNCIAYYSDFSRYDLKHIEYLPQSNKLCWNNDFKNFSAEYYTLYGIKTIKSDNYFALLEETDFTVNIIYFECNENHFLDFINELLNKTNADNFVFMHNGIFENAQKVKYGMVKSLGKENATPKNVYIGITLS